MTGGVYAPPAHVYPPTVYSQLYSSQKLADYRGLTQADPSVPSDKVSRWLVVVYRDALPGPANGAASQASPGVCHWNPSFIVEGRTASGDGKQAPAPFVSRLTELCEKYLDNTHLAFNASPRSYRHYTLLFSLFCGQRQ